MKDCMICPFYRSELNIDIGSNDESECIKCQNNGKDYKIDINLKRDDSSFNFDEVKNLLFEKIKVYFKFFIGSDTTIDEFNDCKITSNFYEYDNFLKDYNKNFKEKDYCYNFIGMNIKEFFNINNKFYEDGKVNPDFINFNGSIYFKDPYEFINYYIDNIYENYYSDAINTLTNNYFNNHHILDKNWYNSICYLIENM